MIRLWKSLHNWKKVKETGAEQIIRQKYEAFLTILAENAHALELMTELEKKLVEKQLISIPYLKNMVKNLSLSIFNVVDNLEKLSGGRYTKLNDVYDHIEREIRTILSGTTIPIYTPQIIPMHDIHKWHIDKVGSKMANLGELRNHCNIPVPDGFGITACAYTHFAEYNNLEKKINRILTHLDIANGQQLLRAEKEVKRIILQAVIPPEIEDAVKKASKELEQRHGRPIFWAVRSSAIGEDRENSFAGQFSSILNVSTEEILDKYKEVVASKYNARNILYQRMKEIRIEDVNMSVAVMEMIQPVCSGVMYTVEPMHPDSEEMIITGIWGLGELLVDGVLSGDMFIVKKDADFTVLKEEIAQKEMRLRSVEQGGVEYEMLSDEDSQKPCLTKEQLKLLAETGVKIEKHFKAPQDIEWCFDQKGHLVILQTRPLHILEHGERRKLTSPIKAPIIAKGGRAVVGGVGSGIVVKVSDIHEVFGFPEGAIMVIRNSSPGFIGALRKAAAVIVEKGNRTDHMSSVARELNVPCVVKVPSIFSILEDGQRVTVDATEGIIYKGEVPELINADAVVIKNPTTEVTKTESYRLLAKIADYIFPLHLTDPRMSNFRESACQTFHDILRFCHETALNEMFMLREKGPVKTIRNVYRIATDLPFKLFVFDMFGNTVKGPQGKEIRPEDIYSLPFQELWKGMAASDVTWNGPEQHMGTTKDMLSAMMRTSAIETQPERAKSFAVVTPEYMNLSLSMGYHYVTLDCYISDDPYNNYISMSFKGGAAETKRRQLRIMLISEILKPLGFDVRVKNDFLKARIKAESKKELSEKIRVIGRMLAVTRLLDMALKDERMVKECVDRFHAHQPLIC